MDRVILHSDLNNFYASVECLENPMLKGKPVCVCGKIEERRGVVLAKNYVAKSFGVKTGMVIWQVKLICPDAIFIDARFSLYLNYSKKVKKIYSEYTDQIESFGIDEAWLDVTHSKIFGSGIEIAEIIRKRVKTEIGLTVSIGVSFNKIFAKLGSDIKKPDAITEISRNNYKKIVWERDVSDLLYVGSATLKKLNKLNIHTIGDLACANDEIVNNHLGKWGSYLLEFARGEDRSEVRKIGDSGIIKSIGNSMTFSRDLVNIQDVSALLTLICESVSSRMLDLEIKLAGTIRLWIKNSNLSEFSCQMKMCPKTGISRDFLEYSLKLFNKNYKWTYPVRALGVNVTNFSDVTQLVINKNVNNYEKNYNLENTVEKLRKKYGRTILSKAIVLNDSKMGELNIKEENVIYPVSFFR